MKRTITALISAAALFAAVMLLFQLPGNNQERIDEGELSGGTQPSEQSSSRLLRINAIEQGERIKTLLNGDDDVKIIHHNPKDKSHYKEHEATVKFSSPPDDDELDSLAAGLDAEFFRHMDSIFVFQSDSMTTADLLQFFRERPDIAYAEPNFILMQNETQLPNDQLYREKYQWNLPAIDIEKAWDISKGDEDIIIAVVDTGVDMDHPDLRKRLMKGYNVMQNSSDFDDDNGHGTHVAGIIASETNNGEGIAGITWNNRIMPVKAMGSKGYGYTFDIAKGIIWAADHGADVINLSLGNYQPSAFLEEAIRYAYDKGAVLISAAGNDNSEQPSFPAAFPEVLSVSAVSYTGEKAEFSNYGYYIDVTAPGVYIPSTYFKNQYAALSGTSMASPHVAGLAGLILSVNPDLSNREVMNIIKGTARDIGEEGRDAYFGNGLIDINAALAAAE
ncbi:S8 family peptidase [Bacillus infantis]|uniref:Peptidase S8 n=1 Tax=Bacillus infantis TaxID=324767 RepID=A0A5D4R8Z1_9BACI|nr:S8 family peptidase [Bacillus infantis]TYS47807.1 peptidase S8 [Bacillus infantis]